MVDRHLPGALIHHHWLWRYTILWDSREPVRLTAILQ